MAMSKGGAEFVIVIGVAFIVASFFVKRFYAAIGNSLLSDEPAPTWMGRLICCVVGAFMIPIGLSFLFPPQ
jgi:hypothetical protein